MPEISDAALAEYQKAHGLMKALYDDSAVGMDFRKIVKAKFPNASMPELDAVKRTEELSSGINKNFEMLGIGLNKKIDGFLEDRRKEQEEIAVNAFSEKIEKLTKERGYTREGQEKLLTLMQERGIHDPEDAAVIFESRQPKTPKSRQFSSRMNFISPDDKDDEKFKQLMADPEQFMVDEMMTALGNANNEE